MRTLTNSKHVLDASAVNFFGNSNPTKSIEFSSVERARPFAATHMSNKLRRAIAVLDELASKDERQCIDRILTPAAAALPNRFEHEHDALTHIRATFGITVSECERASGSARDVFMFAVAKSLTGEELVKTLVENGSSALLASAAGGVWTAEGERCIHVCRREEFDGGRAGEDARGEWFERFAGERRGRRLDGGGRASGESGASDAVWSAESVDRLAVGVEITFDWIETRARRWVGFRT